jgi:hypothetical protein
LVAGYVLGSLQVFAPDSVRAQAAADADQTSQEKVIKAHEAVQAAMDALIKEKRYVPAINGTNAFAVSVGGLDAVRDLESGYGVDPETFAGLYAGLAVDEVEKKLETDDKGVLRYNKKPVQLYPISRLKELFVAREKASGTSKESEKDALK